MPFDVTANPLLFDEALAFFLARAVVTSDELEFIEGDAHSRAFTIANVTQASVVQSVFDDIAVAIQEGQPFEEFKERALGQLGDKWAPREGSSARLETIFRNATQKAYNQGASCR